jgi:hypothetical protein
MAYKEQASAELVRWQLDDERQSVEGQVENSKDEDIVNGDTFMIINFKEIEYHEGYAMVLSQTGKYFILYNEEAL